MYHKKQRLTLFCQFNGNKNYHCYKAVLKGRTGKLWFVWVTPQKVYSYIGCFIHSARIVFWHFILKKCMRHAALRLLFTKPLEWSDGRPGRDAAIAVCINSPIHHHISSVTRGPQPLSRLQVRAARFMWALSINISHIHQGKSPIPIPAAAKSRGATVVVMDCWSFEKFAGVLS